MEISPKNPLFLFISRFPGMNTRASQFRKDLNVKWLPAIINVQMNDP